MKTLLSIVVALSFVFLFVSAQAKTRPEPSVKIGDLVWLNEPGFMTYSDADDFCSNMKQDDGGWRLPTIKELKTLFENKDGLKKMKFDKDYYSLWSSEYSEGTRHQVKLLDMKRGLAHQMHDSEAYGLATCVNPAKK